MKLPALHKYYTVNILLYSLFIQAILLFFASDLSPFHLLFDLLCELLFKITFFSWIPINFVLVGLELLLRKFACIHKENHVTLTNKQKKIVYISGLICFISSLAFIGYLLYAYSKYPEGFFD